MSEDISRVVLVSDMDGTLLNSQKEITEQDRSAIKRFMKLGGRFTVSTGRTIQSFEAYRSMLELDMPVIMYNGAAIHDYKTGKTLCSYPLSLDAKRITKEILNEFPQAGGEVLKLDGTFVFRDNDYEKLHTKLCRIEPCYSELEDISEGDWLKVLFAMAPEDIPIAEIFVKQHGYSTVSFVKSSEIFLEMLPVNITKGSALAEYRRLPGMENCIFAAIGDFDNDIEMIKEADIGAVPSNARDSVKSAADIVLKNSCDTGAVAELIEYIIEKYS